MNEMIERVKTALAEALGPDDGLRFDRMAIAAIEAMREPVKEQIDPGYQAIHDCIDFYNYDSGAGYSVEPFGPSEVWRAMIDAALEDRS